MERTMERIRAAGLLLALAAVAAGCSSRTISTTPRTAIEQMLLSGAVDLALQKVDLAELHDRTVYLDFTNLKAYDAEYIQVATRARFARLGAVLAPKAEGAEYVAEVASGGLGMEHKTAMIGLPAVPIPQAPIPMPELAAYRNVEQTGILKLLIFVHKQGRFVAADQYYAKCDRDEGFLLWWRFQRRDQVREGWEQADLRLQKVRSSEDEE